MMWSRVLPCWRLSPRARPNEAILKHRKYYWSEDAYSAVLLNPDNDRSDIFKARVVLLSPTPVRLVARCRSYASAKLCARLS
jgi:hypothetical protein